MLTLDQAAKNESQLISWMSEFAHLLGGKLERHGAVFVPSDKLKVTMQDVYSGHVYWNIWNTSNEWDRISLSHKIVGLTPRQAAMDVKKELQKAGLMEQSRPFTGFEQDRMFNSVKSALSNTFLSEAITSANIPDGFYGKQFSTEAWRDLANSIGGKLVSSSTTDAVIVNVGANKSQVQISIARPGVFEVTVVKRSQVKSRSNDLSDLRKQVLNAIGM